MATILSGLAAAAIGFMIVRRMVLPIRFLTDRLRHAQAGNLETVPDDLLPPESSEYGRLLRGYNDLVEAFREREALADRLAQRERESMLGRLAATVAHEVRNPLGGMSTALNTARKFGNDPAVRNRALDLIERGLWSIRDVVGSVLAFHRMPPDARQLVPSDIDDLRILIQSEVVRRHLELSWHNCIESGVCVPATEARQIILNLLLNACEASPPGTSIRFEASMAHGVDGFSELIFEVADSGPGLPSGAAATLTETDVPYSHDSSLGIGLQVIRELVRSLDGTIVAASATEEQGCRITVSLPAECQVRREAKV